MRTLATTLLALGLASIAAPAAGAAPQGGGFTPGELVLYSGTLYGTGPSDGALLRIDPQSGQVTHLLDITGQQLVKPGVLAYDPYRERALFTASLPLQTDPPKLWSIDAAGNLTDLGLDFLRPFALTPAAGGRVYFRTVFSGDVLRYLDAADSVHTLMDASGTQPYTPPGWDPGNAEIRSMLYHPGQNALFMACSSLSNWNCGVQTQEVIVHRIPLSADGSRVAGTPACAQVAVDPAGLNEPVGLSNGPGGQLVLVVDNNAPGVFPRMSLIDPETMAVTPYAWNDHPFNQVVRAGSWSDLRGQALILDGAADVLRAFDPGETGPGDVIVPSSPIGNASIFHEPMTLVEVPVDGRGSLVGTYCSAKTTSGGCQPVVSSLGEPSASAGSGFWLRADQVEAGNIGIFFYGQSGPNSAPFQGGTLCVLPPTLRTSPMSSGGSAACSGSYAIDFNAHVASGIDPQLVPGSVVHGQFWFRDPPHPVGGTGLTGGVTFTVCP